MATDENLPYYLKNKHGKVPTNDSQFQVFAQEHLEYEVWMVCEAFKRLREAQRQARSPERTITINLSLEAIAMHSRLLHEFFDEDSKDRWDAKASDLETGLVPDPRAGEASETGATAKKTGFDRGRANREIVHLSYQRFYGEPRQKAWDLSYLPAMRVVLEDFLLRVSDSRMAPETKKSIRKALAEAGFETLVKRNLTSRDGDWDPITTTSSGVVTTVRVAPNHLTTGAVGEEPR